MTTIRELEDNAYDLCRKDEELRRFFQENRFMLFDSFEKAFDHIHRNVRTGKFKANDCIVDRISKAGIAVLELRAAWKYQEVLDSLLIDTENDPNSKDTAARVAKMLVREQFVGRYTEMPQVSSFPNTGPNALDGLYVVGPLTVKSACSHHHVPIEGQAWVGVFPGDKVIGLSKFSRVINWVMRRPQIQEEATRQAAQMIMEISGAKGVGLIVKAKHFCLCHRGVEEPDSFHITSDMLGAMRDNAALKQEFISLVKL